MIDVTLKPESYREATASGRILLKRSTIKAILEKRIEKGDVLQAASIAAIMAAKNTPQIVPLCHPLPLTSVETSFEVGENHIEAKVKVKTTAKTGVEMEALTAVTAALLTIWDMVKSYEKDSTGNYPTTRIQDIKVEEKVKKTP
ncbi:MAG: cyclic pyranopterin monophosphate synthase MoaC [Desulfurococcales archaeon]|nr:cyclic pyranopterin monophosphate synthase MoaC [Desulfurococcales archaeon]